jgi:hypothetical protein
VTEQGANSGRPERGTGPRPGTGEPSKETAAGTEAPQPVTAPAATRATTPAGQPSSSTGDNPAPRRGERLRTAGPTGKNRSDALRDRVASVVWMIAVLCAMVLGLGALLISLDANPDNSMVQYVTDAAKRLDGPFADVFQLEGANARTKTRLVNWGLAALAYLIVGRVLDRIIRA